MRKISFDKIIIFLLAFCLMQGLLYSADSRAAAGPFWDLDGDGDVDGVDLSNFCTFYAPDAIEIGQFAGLYGLSVCFSDADCPSGMECQNAICMASPHPSGSSPTLKGILYYGLQDIWPPPPAYSADAHSVRVPYVSHTLPAGYKDRIYVHDVPFTDYTKATLKATVTNTATAYVDINGLGQNRNYFIRAFRFDDNDLFTGEMSKQDFITTPLETITPVDAHPTISYDWGTDGFTKAFTMDDHGSLVNISHKTDATMGNYLRFQDSGFLFDYEFSIDRMTYYSRQYVSPYYDWELSIDMRFGDGG